MDLLLDWNRIQKALDELPLFRVRGKVRSSRGLILSCRIPAAVGDQCAIECDDGRQLLGEVIGFAGDTADIVLYESGDDIHPGMSVMNDGRSLTVPVGMGLLGRVVDGLGRPLDEKGPLPPCPRRRVMTSAPAPMRRARIRDVFVTGQKPIDGMLTCGRGQRVAIFAGSGVGKSTLLGEITKGAEADIVVLALIGERGREVKPFLEDCLGPQGLARSAVFLATCDHTPLMRVRTAQAALAAACHFRDEGKHVLLMVDSLTRLAMAQRELGLALREPPSARSYTPSVFQLLANYVESMGNADIGSITGLLTVLVDGDDLDEPITDAVRSFVDGHIVLDRRLGEKGHFPAIAIDKSVSRVAHEITAPEHREAQRRLRAMMAAYSEVEDLIRLGIYQPGSAKDSDLAVKLRPQVLEFLRQGMNERTRFETTRDRLIRLTAEWTF